MALARMVVVEGPDVGREFDLPMRGGTIGRGGSNLVELSDPSVSRVHCALELRDGRLALVEKQSLNQTLVNGMPVKRVHLLEDGDQVTVGKTKLAFLPLEAASREIAAAQVTMEIGSRSLMIARPEASESPQNSRAQRHLGSIAEIGEALAKAHDSGDVERTACASIRSAMASKRVILFTRGASGRLQASAAATDSDDTASLTPPQEIVGKVLGEGKSIAIQKLAIGSQKRDVAAAPLWAADNTPFGLLWVDRFEGPDWDRTDVVAVTCLAHLVSSALQSVSTRKALSDDNRSLEAQVGGREFIGTSPAAQAVLKFVAKVGPADATVLLTGESGAGKEMVARALHKASRRQGRAFVAVNCAALTQTLIESELFGHEKGAFTGASERKLGRFELAHQGTLFLDEVGELPLDCQTKFLRVLEEQSFDRVGGGKPIDVDVRVVAATNRDLATMVREGTFREDLYYRLSVIHIEVPPLRQRREDIPSLCEHFLTRLGKQAPRRIKGFSPAAAAALVAYPWPGNVRELKNAVERAIVLGDGDTIEVTDLPPGIATATAGPAGPDRAVVASSTGPQQPVSLRELERAGILAALQATGGNKAQAAAILEIDRSTLYKKIKDYEIDI